jgi:hypothetical protein
MKTINLCGGKSCCPKLIITRNKKLKFQITDDFGGVVKLTVDEARNLALSIFEEVEK